MQGKTLEQRVSELEERVAMLEGPERKNAPEKRIKTTNIDKIKAKFPEHVKIQENKRNYFLNTTFKGKYKTVAEEIERLRFELVDPKVDVYVGFAPGARYYGDVDTSFFNKIDRYLVVIGPSSLAPSEDYISFKTKNFNFYINDLELVGKSTSILCENCFEREATGLHLETNKKFCSGICAKMYFE